jgi:hypothetical protein
MIGGKDTVLPGAGPADEGEFIVGKIRSQWPDLVVQDAAQEDAIAFNDPAVGTMVEFFVYRSQADYESWTTDGASETNGDTMIHVILGPSSTTFVTEGQGSATHACAVVLCRELAVHRLVKELEARRARVRAPPPKESRKDLDLEDRLLTKGDRRGPTESIARA